MNKDTKEGLGFLSTLTPRERKLVQELAAGTGYTRAMRLAGYARSTARTQQARTRDKPRIKRALLEIYYRRGYHLTDEELTLIGKDPVEERLAEELITQEEAEQEAKMIVARMLVKRRR